MLLGVGSPELWDRAWNRDDACATAQCHVDSAASAEKNFVQFFSFWKDSSQQYISLFRSLFDFRLQCLEVIPLTLALMKGKKIIRKADCAFQFQLICSLICFLHIYLYFS